MVRNSVHVNDLKDAFSSAPNNQAPPTSSAEQTIPPGTPCTIHINRGVLVDADFDLEFTLNTTGAQLIQAVNDHPNRRHKEKEFKLIMVAGDVGNRVILDNDTTLRRYGVKNRDDFELEML